MAAAEVAGGGGGAFLEGVGSVAATAEAASIRVHHSIVELPDANYKPRIRSARRLRRFVVRELRRPAWPADDATLHPVTGCRRKSVREGERSGQADHLLPRSRRTRSDSLCSMARAGGTRRSKRPATATRFRSSCCPTASAPGHSLQRHQLGSPFDTRMEHRGKRDRSTHRRNHQGRRHARIASDPPGLHDRGRAPESLQDRNRDAAGTDGLGPRAYPSAVGTRGRSHAGHRTQLLRQRSGPDLGDGLPASARHDEAGQHVRLFESLRCRHRRGTRWRSLSVIRTSPLGIDEAKVLPDPR